MGRFAFHLLLIFSPVILVAQQGPTLSYYLPSDGEYDPSVPTPESFFGFQVGEWHLQPEQVHAYIKELGRVSERIKVLPMGKSHESREILLAVITDPGNHARLGQIQEAHLALSDPSVASAGDVSTMPVVVWMGYSVHGNEASGSNASVLVAYYLAASKDPWVTSALRDAVVLFNPSINPDGLNRFASWVNANKGSVLDPSPSSREHNEPWPGGRTNHYWFDLNRDWMPLQHPESRARIRQYYAWRPNLLTDHHEMGSSSTFFFQPGIPSRNNPLVPHTVGDLTTRIAAFHAQALDSIGSLYYSGESFDDFYIGKGSSYPDITGGVGILFEQASVRGHTRTVPGGEMTFPFAIRNQVTTSFSTLRAAVHLRMELLNHQREMARTGLTLAGRSRTKAYVFGTGSDMARTEALAGILHEHAINVFRTRKNITAGSAAFRAGEAFIVPVEQVQYRLITSLFERRTSFQDSLFYDVSAWSLPLAFGLPYAELQGVDRDALGEPFDPERLAAQPPLPGNVPFYVLSWSEYFAPKALGRLFDRDIVPRMAFEEIKVITTEGERSFHRGAVIVPVGMQKVSPEVIREVMEEVRSEDGVRVFGIVTGRSPMGIDLGSPNVHVLESPRIALLAGDGVSPTDAGEIWHLLDHRYHRTVTLLDPRSIGRRTLHEVSVVIMPAGRYGDLDSQQVRSLLEWVEEGNTLIALEQAAAWVVRNKLAQVKLAEEGADRRDTNTVVLYGEESQMQGARRVPGAVVSALIDATHPLLFGVNSEALHLFKSTPYAFAPSARRAITPVLYGRDPLVSGYLHPRTVERISGKAAIAVAPKGRGTVILLADNQTFRAYWYGTSRILANAVFLAPFIRAPESEE